MKKNKPVYLILLLLISVNISFAQLASNKPMRSFYSARTIGVLDKQKASTPNKTKPVLQSEKPMAEITMPATKRKRQPVVHPNNNLTAEQKKKILASNTVTLNNKYSIKKKK